MRIHFDVTHPAHVHTFRNCIQILRSRGEEVLVTARPKEVTQSLLEAHEIPYRTVGRHGLGRPAKAKEGLNRIMVLLQILRRFRPDVMVGVHNPYVATTSALLGVPSAIFIDSEPVAYDRWITHPFASWMVTPRRFGLDLGNRQIRVDSFKELAYLHPSHFAPNAQVLEDLSVAREQRYFLLRFSAFHADHDRGHHGFSLRHKIELVNHLKQHGRVYISSEAPLPPSLASYESSLPPHRFHDALAFASLLVTDSQTTATEAAILGTPAVRFNSLVGLMSNFEELENRYGLLYSVRDPRDALALATELAGRENIKEEWAEKRQSLLREKVDLTEFFLDLVDRIVQGRVAEMREQSQAS